MSTENKLGQRNFYHSKMDSACGLVRFEHKIALIYTQKNQKSERNCENFLESLLATCSLKSSFWHKYEWFIFTRNQIKIVSIHLLNHHIVIILLSRNIHLHKNSNPTEKLHVIGNHITKQRFLNSQSCLKNREQFVSFELWAPHWLGVSVFTVYTVDIIPPPHGVPLTTSFYLECQPRGHPER
jgi:hypothetical protein